MKFWAPRSHRGNPCHAVARFLSSFPSDCLQEPVSEAEADGVLHLNPSNGFELCLKHSRSLTFDFLLETWIKAL